MTREEISLLINELLIETKGKLDGSRKNIISDCPWCGKRQKYGIRVAPDEGKRKRFMSHCFSCGRSTYTLDELLDLWERPDLRVNEQLTTSIPDLNDNLRDNDDELDDSLVEVEMPEGFKLTNKNRYMKKRGYTKRDYEYFPVGTTRGMNFRYNDYVIFPIVDSGKYVGFVSRHTWSKSEIDEYNQRQALVGGYQIQRYRNSYGEGYNDFSRLLYNFDNVIEDETDTVILVEGCFDCIALTRQLNLYDNHRIACVATFGKKISEVQAFKLQHKGVRTILIAYDSDAADGINRAADFLSPYFDVYILKLMSDKAKDWDEVRDWWEIFDSFSEGILTPFEFKNRL